MIGAKTSRKDRYFTDDHEWIDFHGSVAYIGICRFKLTGFKEVQKITFEDPLGFKRKGETIATMHYKDYRIEVHMPVDGKVIELNSVLVSGDLNDLLQHAEGSSWIARIVPSQPYERTGLVPPDHYRMNGKSKHAK